MQTPQAAAFTLLRSLRITADDTRRILAVPADRALLEDHARAVSLRLARLEGQTGWRRMLRGSMHRQTAQRLRALMDRLCEDFEGCAAEDGALTPEFRRRLQADLKRARRRVSNPERFLTPAHRGKPLPLSA